MLLKSVHRQTDRQRDRYTERQTDRQIKTFPSTQNGFVVVPLTEDVFRTICHSDTHMHTHRHSQGANCTSCANEAGKHAHTSLWNSVKVIVSSALCALSSLVTHLNGPDRNLPIHPEDQLPDRESTHSDNCTTFNNKFPPNQRKTVHDLCLYHQWQREINRRPSWQGSLYINVDKKGTSDNENTDGLPE